jgi:ABC-type transport system involved in multi-copper enzyme maturation permease subunit
LSFLSADRIVVDFGISAIDLSVTVMAALLGVQAMNREIERRTLWVALARPITRMEFFIGKWIGVMGIVKINAYLLLLVLFGVLYTQVDTIEQLWRPTLVLGTVFLIFQGGVVSALAMAMSAVFTPSLTLSSIAALYLAGRSVSDIRTVAVQIQQDLPLLSKALTIISYLLPDFELFHLGSQVTYDVPINWIQVLGTFSYGLLLIVVFLLWGGGLMNWRER